MVVPSVSSSVPADGASDVFLNKPITATFAAALDTDSISATSVTLLNVATDDVVATSLSYDTSSDVLTITPLSTLEESTVYKLRFPGTDIAISASHVLLDSGSSTRLATTISITFTTGTRMYLDDTAVDKDATDLSLEGDLSLPIHVKALGDFVIESTQPKNHKSDVGVSLYENNSFYVQFNKALSGSLLTDDWLDIDVYPILDVDAYLAEGDVLNTGTVSSVTGLWVSGAYLWAGFGAAVPQNCGVSATVSEDVTATDGSEFGPSDYELTFTTDRYPSVAGAHVIRREIKAAADEVNDDYIASLLFKNTIRLMERGSYATGAMDAPSWLISKYVINATVVDILDDQELEKALRAGTRRQLGDMGVSVDAIVGRLSLKHARAQKALDEADRAIQGSAYLAKKVTEQIVSTRYDRPSRQWYGVNGKLIESRFKYWQRDHPASNSALNRQAKNPPSAWWI